MSLFWIPFWQASEIWHSFNVSNQIKSIHNPLKNWTNKMTIKMVCLFLISTFTSIRFLLPRIISWRTSIIFVNDEIFILQKVITCKHTSQKAYPETYTSKAVAGTQACQKTRVQKQEIRRHEETLKHMGWTTGSHERSNTWEKAKKCKDV